MCTVIALLTSRLAYIQIIKPEQYIKQADANFKSRIQVNAPRGVFYDRNNQIILGNKKVSNFVFFRQKKLPSNEIIQTVAETIEKPIHYIQSKIKQSYLQPKYIPIVIKRNLNLSEISEVENKLSQVPGFEVMTQPGRSYSKGQPLHMLGHLAEISRTELKKSENENYSRGDLVGKKGLERIFEKELVGKKGLKVVNVDARGSLVDPNQNEYSKKPIPGHNIHLTIDYDLQNFVFETFRHKRGAVIAMDPRNGKILAIKSSPTYPPELFQSQLSTKAWNIIANNPFAPLIDKTIRAEYPPGSLYKVVVGLAALQENKINEHTTFKCTGHFNVNKEKFHCHKRSGHGRVNLKQAMRYSCDSFFYQIGLELGVDKIASYAKKFMLGSSFGIRFGTEKTGLIPTREWKYKKKKVAWKRGETLPVSIGQGFNLTTPLQLVNLFSSIANGGKVWKPYVVQRTSDYYGKVIKEFEPELLSNINDINPEHFELIKKSLIEVTTHPKGTGRLAKSSITEIAGKSGSVQVVKLKRYAKGEQVSMLWKEHAIFAGFAPANNPKITVLVFSEHDNSEEGGGKAAGPIVKNIIEHYLSIENQNGGKRLGGYPNQKSG